MHAICSINLISIELVCLGEHGLEDLIVTYVSFHPGWQSK